MTAGEALLVILDSLGLTQVDLARLAGVSTKHINQVVRGNARLSAEVAVAIADAIAEHLVALDAKTRLSEARSKR